MVPTALIRSRWLLRAICCSMVALPGAACAKTTSTEVWKNPKYTSQPANNIIVFSSGMNETERHTVEDSFVKALSNHGVHATASYVTFPGPVPDQQTALGSIATGRYDGVLLSTMHGATDRFVSFETTLWDPNGGGTMVWSDVTRTLRSPSASGVIQSLVDSVIQEMEKAGLVPNESVPDSSAPQQTLR